MDSMQRGSAESTNSELSAEHGSRPLERLLVVLECVAEAQGEANLSLIASATRLPKPTVHRLLATLVASGLVTATGPNRYASGGRLARLLQIMRDPDSIAALARPTLRRLADVTNETCYMTKLIDQQVKVVLMEMPKSEWRNYFVYVLPGKQMLPHAAASAKAIMAFQPQPVIAAALAQSLPRLTSHTKLAHADILAEYEDVRARNCAVCDAEVDEGLSALAVPIHLAGAGVLFAIGVTGPSIRLSGVNRAPLFEALRGAAEQLSLALDLLSSR